MTASTISAPSNAPLTLGLKYLWRHLGIRQYALERRLQKNKNEWLNINEKLKIKPAKNSLLIIPPDPSLLISSVGDQAMILSIINHWHNINSEMKIFFATSDIIADEAARQLSAHPIRMMGNHFSPSEIAKLMDRERFKAVILMGADGMDGSYDPAFSAEQLMALDIAAKCGAECSITGFSVSKVFHNDVIDVFKRMDPSIIINLRDPISLQRFESLTYRKGNQVADLAFLLNPVETSRIKILSEYIKQEKIKNRIVIGVNFHPLLLELKNRGRFNELVGNFSEMLKNISSACNASFVLISHDTRGESSDSLALRPLYSTLKGFMGDRITLVEEQLSAAEVKALVGYFDMVLTGRMHLMIASLGSGTPVLGVEYKDKMAGLLNLFGLDSGSLITAADILRDPAKCARHIVNYISTLDIERKKISLRLDEIHDLSLRNFERP